MRKSEKFALAALRQGRLRRIGPHWGFERHGRRRLFRGDTIKLLVEAGLARVDGKEVSRAR